MHALSGERRSGMYFSDDMIPNSLNRLPSSAPDSIHAQLHRLIDSLSEEDAYFLLELVHYTSRSGDRS
jgi:hypothetical protein